MNNIRIDYDGYGAAFLVCDQCKGDVCSLELSESVAELVEAAEAHECLMCEGYGCDEAAVLLVEEWRRESGAGTQRGWRFRYCGKHTPLTAPEKWADVGGLSYELMEWRIVEVKTGVVKKSGK